MANLLLGVTGSVAAIKTPELVALLRAKGHALKIVATEAAMYFFDAAQLPVYRDAAEWPRDRYQHGDEVLHIELRRWSDVLLVAPLDANTLAKFATGICDNCLTCVWRAWDPARPTVVAPAMNTFMWEHPLTQRQLQALADDAVGNLRIVGPQSKELACGDFGLGAMADVAAIAAAVEEMVARSASRT